MLAFKLTTSTMGSINTHRPMPRMAMNQPLPVVALPSAYKEKDGDLPEKKNAIVDKEAGVVSWKSAFKEVEDNDEILDDDYKPLDANRYATKKTIAQGMLDIALLTANASQLKYVLTIGQQHQFYSLMISLITISIFLQVLQAIISLVLGSAYNINKKHHQQSANIWNNVCLSLIIITVAINIVISAFDMRETDSIVHIDQGRNGTFSNESTFLGRLFGR